MAKRPEPSALRCILIAGYVIPGSSQWQFLVILVHAGDLRVLSSWGSYEDAMLAAESAARDHQGERLSPLPVHDHVVRPR